MDKDNFYKLPPLLYGYGDLNPFISEEQLTIHYTKHHQAYINNANKILEKLDNARQAGTEIDVKAMAKDFSFQFGGIILHSVYWQNMLPTKLGGGGEPRGKLKEMIEDQYNSLDRFKQEFVQGAVTIEGSGWMSLSYCRHTGRLLMVQIEKHNCNILAGHPILLVLDMFEHAYYIDYKNDKVKYIDAFWNLINWNNVSERLEQVF